MSAHPGLATAMTEPLAKEETTGRVADNRIRSHVVALHFQCKPTFNLHMNSNIELV